MSFFGVTLRTIKKVEKHPNADKLSIAAVSGTSYSFVIMLDQFKVGDEVLYFPIDSILPLPVIEKLGLVGKLAGKEKNRVKTIRLRNMISQGIVAPPSLFDADFNWKAATPEEITAKLGVTKYEPEPVPCHAGNLVKLPEGVGVYDIEGADTHLDIVELLMNQKVFVSEKLEGSNFAVDVNEEGKVTVCQRQYAIEPIEGQTHTFWRVAREQGLISNAILMWEDLKKPITIRGEMLGSGVQGDYYKFKTNKILVFDIMINHEYVNPKQFLELCVEYALETVPCLCFNKTLVEWLEGKTVKEASNGKSVFGEMAKEGLVIKPMQEQRHSTIGRLMLKQRSPEYLANEK